MQGNRKREGKLMRKLSIRASLVGVSSVWIGWIPTNWTGDCDNFTVGLIDSYPLTNSSYVGFRCCGNDMVADFSYWSDC